MDTTERAERQGRVLAELSELGLAAAREVQARLLAAETARDAADLALALGRLTRCVRQSLALEARLERDRERAAREDRVETAREDGVRVARRKAQVKAAVARLIWTEAEGDEAENLLDELDERLDEAALYDGFAADPVDAHIARLCEQLGVASPLAGEGVGRASTDEAARPPLRETAGSEVGPPRCGGPSPGPLRGLIPDHPWRSTA